MTVGGFLNRVHVLNTLPKSTALFLLVPCFQSTIYTRVARAVTSYLEALLYAIDKVNNEILKGLDFKLGTLTYDTCYSDTEALKRAQQYVTYRIYTLERDSIFKCADSSRPSLNNNGTLIGVVGAATSVVSIQLASFFRLFQIPQISYGATSTELSATSRYDFFMRNVVSETHQARAIVEILKRFQWTYVTCVHDDTSYGERGYQEIFKLAQEEKSCIAEAMKVKQYVSSEDANQRQLEDAIRSLRRHNNTEGILRHRKKDLPNCRQDGNLESFPVCGK
ncbi:metabotropic glutamate receptor-like [Dreissena polymorpha]|uniref:metabotropic glutamate receptor-like n=1 Tax=Dreissena polymorpha TaxID=45954 RepID=UPI002264AFF4|nr:metabotropic glutamate receptor-like [Dreissena polymorpha]